MRELFKLALKRDPGLFVPEDIVDTGPLFVLGIGETGKYKSSQRFNYRALGLPFWCFPRDEIPFENESVSFIHCYHFMEHLSGALIPAFMLEVQRVLRTGGIFQYGVPMAGSELSYQDLDHKSFWTTSSFRNLLDNEYYHGYTTSIENREIRLKVQSTAIIGVAERNLMVVGQLIKE